MIRITLIAVVLATVISLTIAQRPPYAGSRPIGYKDRFRPRPTGAAGGLTATANDIDNRFGEPNNLTNSTNVTQRPPVGVEVVYGEPSDPDEQQQQQQQEEQQPQTRPQQPQQLDQQQLDVVNRLGVAENDQQQVSNTADSFSSISSSPTGQGFNTENSSTDLFTGGDSRKPSIVTVTTVATPTFNRRPPTTVIPFRQTTLSHVPYDAHGDVFLVNLLNQRPVDQQPFWFVNYQAIEAHRNGTRSQFS